MDDHSDRNTTETTRHDTRQHEKLAKNVCAATSNTVRERDDVQSS